MNPQDPFPQLFGQGFWEFSKDICVSVLPQNFGNSCIITLITLQSYYLFPFLSLLWICDFLEDKMCVLLNFIWILLAQSLAHLGIQIREGGREEEKKAGGELSAHSLACRMWFKISTRDFGKYSSDWGKCFSRKIKILEILWYFLQNLYRILYPEHH